MVKIDLKYIIVGAIILAFLVTMKQKKDEGKKLTVEKSILPSWFGGSNPYYYNRFPYGYGYGFPYYGGYGYGGGHRRRGGRRHGRRHY